MAKKKGDPGQGTPAKRPNLIVWERDLSILLQGRCELKSPAEILDELNRVRAEEARRVATERGLPPEAVEEFAAYSRLSIQTLRRDLRKLQGRMTAGNNAQGAELFRRQYDRLEALRQVYLMAERRAWEELGKSSAGTSTQTETREAIDIEIPPEAKISKEAEVLVRRVMQPRTESRRVARPAAADPAWFAIIDQLLWRQVQLAEKMFELEAILGLETPPDVAALAALAPADAREGFIEHDLRMLYSPEARAAKIDPGAFQARFKLLESWMAMKQKRAEGAEEEGGGSGFRVVGLQVEIDVEPS